MLRTPRLRDPRERAALSQQALAARSGVATATIGDLEAGKRPARPSTLRKLAKALKVEVTELYEEADSPLGQAPPTQGKPFNNGALEEEWRRELAEVERFVGFALARADYWLRDLERGRAEEYATADGAYKLAVRALEEFEDIYRQLYDRVAHDLLVAMEEGGGVSREAEEAYDRLHGQLLARTTETQRALFDRAESLAETPTKREKLANEWREKEAATQAKVVSLFPSPRRDQAVSAGEARR